jgi:hypothetical protein
LERRCLEWKKLKRELLQLMKVAPNKHLQPSGGGNGSKPSTPMGSKADQLASKMKVLKLQEKIAKLKRS